MRDAGFTLLELMIVLAIIAVTAAIAIPEYQRYIVRNAQYDATDALLQVKADAERWKAKALSYRGFPNTYVTDTGRYTITVADAGVSTRPNLTDATAIGSSWVAFAAPDADTKGARFLLFSNGQSCKMNFGESNFSNFNNTSNCNLSGAKPWEE